jgi:hypothetical protein
MIRSAFVAVVMTLIPGFPTQVEAAQEDTTTCIRERTDVEKRITACTREINSENGRAPISR